MNDPIRLNLPSASAFEILAECNGQPQMLRKLPPEAFALKEQNVDPLAERGTRIHRARETGNTLELDKEETDLYQAGLRYEERLLEKWKETFSLQEITEGPRELRLWLHEPGNLDPVCSGQLDVHFISGTRALCTDWKTAFCSNLVGAKGNWQLRLQAVLLKIEYPQLTDIRVAFAKPMYEDSQLDYADYSEIDLKYSLDSILYLLWWSTQEDAPRRAGKHCRYCPAKAWCPEALSFSLLPSSILQLADKNVIWKKPDQSVPLVSNEDLYRLWDAGSVIRNILDAISDRLKTMPDEALAEIGLKHGKGRQILEWTDTRGAYEFLVEEKRWDQSALWNALEFGLGKLAKVAEKETGIDEKYSKDEVKKILAEFIAFKEGEPMLRKLR